MSELYGSYAFPEEINHEELLRYIGQGMMYVIRAFGKILSLNAEAAAIQCFGQPA